MGRTLAMLTLGAAALAAGVAPAQESAPAPALGQPAAAATAAPAAAPPPGVPTVALGAAGAPPPEEAAPPPAAGNETAEADSLPTPDEKKAEPLKRPRFASAILEAVDKTTAETLRFEAKVGEPVRYKGLVLTVHACEGAASDEAATDSFVHLDIQAQPQGVGPQPTRNVFRGWMFANSPGLHPLEHPLYDVWLIACKTAAPAAPGVSL